MIIIIIIAGQPALAGVSRDDDNNDNNTHNAHIHINIIMHYH